MRQGWRAWEELVGSRVKFHWSSPDLPAFCLRAPRPARGSAALRHEACWHSWKVHDSTNRDCMPVYLITFGTAPHHRVDGQVCVHERVVEPPGGPEAQHTSATATLHCNQLRQASHAHKHGLEDDLHKGDPRHLPL